MSVLSSVFIKGEKSTDFFYLSGELMTSLNVVQKIIKLIKTVFFILLALLVCVFVCVLDTDLKWRRHMCIMGCRERSAAAEFPWPHR